MCKLCSHLVAMFSVCSHPWKPNYVQTKNSLKLEMYAFCMYKQCIPPYVTGTGHKVDF